MCVCVTIEPDADASFNGSCKTLHLHVVYDSIADLRVYYTRQIAINVSRVSINEITLCSSTKRLIIAAQTFSCIVPPTRKHSSKRKQSRPRRPYTSLSNKSPLLLPSTLQRTMHLRRTSLYRRGSRGSLSAKVMHLYNSAYIRITFIARARCIYIPLHAACSAGRAPAILSAR